MKKIIGIIIITVLIFTTTLVAFNSNTKDKLIGTWKGSSDSTMVLNKDNTAQVDGGSGVIQGKWSIKNGYLYIDRESKADLKAKIPDGDFKSLTVEEDRNGNSFGVWNTEIFTK